VLIGINVIVLIAVLVASEKINRFFDAVAFFREAMKDMIITRQELEELKRIITGEKGRKSREG